MLLPAMFLPYSVSSVQCFFSSVYAAKMISPRPAASRYTHQDRLSQKLFVIYSATVTMMMPEIRNHLTHFLTCAHRKIKIGRAHV